MNVFWIKENCRTGHGLFAPPPGPYIAFFFKT